MIVFLLILIFFALIFIAGIIHYEKDYDFTVEGFLILILVIGSGFFLAAQNSANVYR